MIVKITRGDRMAGLMMYLLGPQREDREHKNVHTDEHVIAGHDAVMFGAPRGRMNADQIFDISNALDLPRRIFGTRVTVPVKEWDEAEQKRVKVGERDAHVWHASLAIKAGEGPLSDAMWSSIARDFVAGMGFTDEDGAKSSRWVAVRHGASKEGNDHVHVAVSLVREDGSKARINNDFKRASQLVNELEHKYGLTILESREAESATPETAAAKGDLRRASQHAMAPERQELARRLRAASIGADSESAYIEQLRALRVLVRPRYQDGGRDKVVGYSVALYPEKDKSGALRKPVWHAPSKLDSTLGLGALRASWNSTPETEQAAVELWRTRHRELGHERFGLPPRMTLSSMSPANVARLNSLTGEVVIPQTGRIDKATVAHLSGAFAQASMVFERNQHGPLAKASDDLARMAQKPKFDPADPQRAKREEGEDAGYQARLMQRAVSADSGTGWLAVMRQMARTSRAIADAQAQAGYATRAAVLNTHVQQAVASVELALAQMPGTASPAATTSRATPTMPVGRPTQPGTRRPDQGFGRD